MRHGGTDMLAVACIVGGGVLAGGVTLALAGGPALPSLECATHVGPDASVVMELGDERLVMVTPDVRLREVRECMDAEDVEEAVRVEVRRSVDLAERQEMERAEREVERTRREVERVRREVERVRERVGQVGGERAERARAQAERARERAERARERARAQAERARERAERARERAEAARELRHDGVHVDRHRIEALTREALDRARARGLAVDGIDLDEVSFGVEGDLLDGFTIELPDRSFQFRFEGLDNLDIEVDGLEDMLRLQLEVLDGMELDFEGVDEEMEEEIERRIEQKMQELEERLERLGNEIGR